MHIKGHILRIGFLVYSTILAASILSTNANAATYYLSPAGSDSQSGISASTPWRTFRFAIPKLRPSDTLLLLDGTYTKANSGLPQLTCGSGGVANGTASQPITMKAQNEREARIQSDGTLVALSINQCSYWVIEGIYLRSADNPTNSGGNGSVILTKASNHLTLRRLLVTHNNRYFNGNGIEVVDTNNSLFEENEIYFMHRHGIVLFSGSRGSSPAYNTLRRNYVNSRAYADIPGGRYSYPVDRGDGGISCYPCNHTIFENNIAETWGAGFDIQAKTTTSNNTYLGDIALNNYYGAALSARGDFGNSLDSMPQNTQLTNFISIGDAKEAVSLYLRSNKNTHCDQCTLINMAAASTKSGFKADENGTAVGDGSPTVFANNVLVVQNQGYAFSLKDQASWRIDHAQAFGNPIKFWPAQNDPHYANPIIRDPGLGSCKVFIPNTSSAKHAGTNGQDIGANVLYRYQDGVLTTTPLWEPTTGRFPCGAQVAGVNDLAGSSCFDVHKRLNVNTNGCTLPPLGSSQPPTASSTPTNLRIIGSSSE